MVIDNHMCKEFFHMLESSKRDKPSASDIFIVLKLKLCVSKMLCPRLILRPLFMSVNWDLQKQFI